MATLTQVKKVLSTQKWACEAYHVAYDPETESNFALVTAHGDPPNQTLEVNGSLPWTILAAPKAPTASKPTFTIVAPDHIHDTNQEGGAPSSGHNPAQGTLLEKATQRPYLHDLMTAGTPDTPPPKRQRSVSVGSRQARGTGSGVAGGHRTEPSPPAADAAAKTEGGETPCDMDADEAGDVDVGGAPTPAPPDGATTPRDDAPPTLPGPPHPSCGPAVHFHPGSFQVPMQPPPWEQHDLSVHNSDSEPEDSGNAPVGHSHGLTDEEATRLGHLETAHSTLASQVDGIQDCVNQLLSTQSTLSGAVQALDSGLASVAAQQQTDAATTQQALHLILQRLPAVPPGPVAFSLHPNLKQEGDGNEGATREAGDSAGAEPATEAAHDPYDPESAASLPTQDPKGKGKDTASGGYPARPSPY